MKTHSLGENSVIGTNLVVSCATMIEAALGESR